MTDENSIRRFFTGLSQGIKSDNLFQKSAGLAFLLVLLTFPAFFLFLASAGYYIDETDAVAKVNRYLYEIIPVEPEYKEPILNNVFIFSEQITANYFPIAVSGFLTLGVLLYYITNYLNTSISSFGGIEVYSRGIVSTGINFLISWLLFIVSFVLTTLLFDPFSFIKVTFVLTIGAKLLIFLGSLVTGYYMFSRILKTVFPDTMRKYELKYSIVISLVLFELLKNFYLYYLFFISRPAKITGVIEMIFISLIMLFYFSLMIYLSLEIRLTFKRISHNKT